MIRLLACGAFLTAGCTHTIKVHSESTQNVQLIVNGADLGTVSPEGTAAEVPLGAAAVPYEVHGNDGSLALGDIQRTEPVYWLLGLSALGCMCCAPSAAMGGYLIANPTLLSAPLLILVTGDIGLFTKVFNYPGWFTVPLMTACGTVGMSPLAGVFFAELPPDDVTLPAPAPKVAALAPQGMPY